MIRHMPARALVLLPGMDGGDKLFGPLQEAAPADTETVAVGYPPGPHNGYDDLLPLVRAQLPPDRPFFLLGWSFSGPLALLAAAERPPGPRGVILAAPFVKTPVPWLPRWAGGRSAAASRASGPENDSSVGNTSAPQAHREL